MKYLVLATGLLLSLSVQAAPTFKKLKTYKCYVLLETQNHAVIDVSVDKSNEATAKKKAAQSQYILPNTPAVPVKSAIQCVKPNQQFNSALANKLDKEVLR